ncbi:MAG: radical SAM protein [Thermodesulfobacteriota bacterium]|nr:radical SAM protein [Thermodesulfobacteriota bacterium]
MLTLAEEDLREKHQRADLDALIEESRQISWNHFGKKVELYYSYYEDTALKINMTEDVKENYNKDFITELRGSLSYVPPIINISGLECELRCDHCNRLSLWAMQMSETPEKLYETAKLASSNGARGILLSGGSYKDGTTMIKPEMDKIIYRIKKEFNLYIGIHVGYISRQRVRELKDLGVDSLLVDIIGDQETLKRVYHIDRPLSVIDDVIRYTVEEEIDVIPHICIGLHYGEIKGEYSAIDMLAKYPLKYVTFIMLVPMPKTKMAGLSSPEIEEVVRVMTYGRVKLPKVVHSMGCMRPIGRYGEQMEELALSMGCNRIANVSSDNIFSKCNELGIEYEIAEGCCMVGNGMFDHLLPDQNVSGH